LIGVRPAQGVLCDGIPVVLPPMNSIPLDGAMGIGLVVGVMTAIQVGWYIAVIVFLFKIWSKVKHLPS
jgi:hypothetical protein